MNVLEWVFRSDSSGGIMADSGLSALLERKQPVLIDGAIGTELDRRGLPTELPLWSAHALISDSGLAILREIHADYARAGAEILVTNTFRTVLRTLDRVGRGGEWRLLNRRAVEAARNGATAVSGRTCLVAGGIAPLEDCYRPDLVPDRGDCRAEHGRQVELFAELGVDLIMLETMNNTMEAEAALIAARETGFDVILSLCPKEPHHLLSDEPLDEAVPALLAAGGGCVRVVTLNCAPPEVLEVVYPHLRAILKDHPHGLYAHLGEPDDTVGWRLPEKHEPDRYAEWVAARLREGARLVGGCCGTGPGHIAALSRLIAA